MKTVVLPVRQRIRKTKARAITDADRKFGAHVALRHARSTARMWGIREKKAKERAEAESNK